MAATLTPRQLLGRLRGRPATAGLDPARAAARLARARHLMAGLAHVRPTDGTSWALTYCGAELEVEATLTALARERDIDIDRTTTLAELALALVDGGHLSTDAGMVVGDVVALTAAGSAGSIEDPRTEASVAQVARHLVGHLELRRHLG